MVQTTSSHSIAPAAVLRGEGAWAESLPQIKALCSRPLVLGRSSATAELRQHLTADLESVGLAPTDAQLQFDCCELDLARKQIEAVGCDAVLAAGGGKVEDDGECPQL